VTSQKPRTIRVVLVDDERLVRSGLRMILESAGDIEVVGEAGDGGGAVEQVRLHRPEVVLMDIRMPAMDGLAATRELTALPDPPRIIMLTTFELDEYVHTALDNGAVGFLLKDTPPRDLIQAVHTVAEGNAMLAPSVTRRLIAEFAARNSTQAVLDHDLLQVDKPHHCSHRFDLAGTGILLVPCAFIWPAVSVECCGVDQPTITYPTRGVAELWTEAPAEQIDPLSSLVGRTRATLLATLGLPRTTTQLAAQLDLSPPAVSQHLKVLKDTGLVTARRRGRMVLYRRTAAATTLLEAVRSSEQTG
jgi:DNA-binding NarL/FixJ family response regulator/DNA-binding transcriptional ArsR family regulator